MGKYIGANDLETHPFESFRVLVKQLFLNRKVDHAITMTTMSLNLEYDAPMPQGLT